MTTNVLPMEVARKPPRAKPSKPPATAAVPKVSAKTARRITWQRRSAALLGTVASAMTVVSLTHIAGGVQLITHDAIPAWQAWGLAVGLARIIHESTPFFISAQCTRAVCLS